MSGDNIFFFSSVTEVWHIWMHIFKVYSLIYKFFNLFTERERDLFWERGRVRKRGRERISSSLCPVSEETNAWLEAMNLEMMYVYIHQKWSLQTSKLINSIFSAEEKSILILGPKSFYQLFTSTLLLNLLENNVKLPKNK